MSDLFFISLKLLAVERDKNPVLNHYKIFAASALVFFSIL